jgi:glycosyltransferase involved in cell wall biosynthesis
MPKVSVITTVYNAEKYIHESLDSIFNQTFQDFELILVNDCSTDNTESVLQEYVDKHNNITLVKNDSNRGVFYGRNRGLLLAQGEYVAIHDADDVSLPERLEKEVSFLDRHQKIVFVGSYALRISQTGEEIGSMVYPPRDTGGAFSVITRFKLNPIIDPSSMYRREIILNHGGYTLDPALRTVADFELWCRLLCHGCLMANIQEPLIKYRINPKGVTRTENQTMMEATDLVWARFRRKHFTDPDLSTELFEQDIFGEPEYE